MCGTTKDFMAKEVNMNPKREEKKPREIPFGKPVRIRNYKMWRTRISIEKKKVIQAIVISDLNGLWMVRIPETYLMFRALTDLYSTEDLNDFEILFTFLNNFNFCTQISHGSFQNFFVLCIYGYMHPEVLDKGYEPEDKKYLSYDEFLYRVKRCIEEYKLYVEEEKKRKEAEASEEQPEEK